MQSHTNDAVTIRPFTDADYAAAIAVQNTVWPDYPRTEAEWRFRDATRDPKCRWARFLAEDAATGAVVACGGYGQSEDMWHPRKFHIDVDVLPEWQGKGIGSRLYEQIVSALAPFDPLVLRTHARADKARALSFLQHRGFVEEMREWESRLEMASFDPSGFAGAQERVAAQGIAITTLAELKERDPDYARKIFDLDWAVTLDMPAPDTLTQPSFEHWQAAILHSPNALFEAWFVARDGDRYVGESTLWKKQGGTDLEVGATGVLREYRRRGIALALKLHACAFAQAYGCPEIRTWNAQSNRAMLSINEALGFVKQPAWISYARVVSEEEKEEAADGK